MKIVKNGKENYTTMHIQRVEATAFHKNKQ